MSHLLSELTSISRRLNRRECLMGLAGLAASPLPAAAAAKAAPPRRIFAVGGGLLSGDRDHRLLRFVISLTGKSNPVVCDLPTASGVATVKR